MKKTLKMLWQFLKPYKFKLLLSEILLIITVGTITSSPLVEGYVINQLFEDVLAIQNGTLAHVQFDITLKLLIALALIYVLSTVSRLIMQIILSDDIQSAGYDLRMAVKRKMSRVDISYFDRHSTGDMMSRISTDVEVISNALQQSLSAIFQAILMLCISVTMMLVIDDKMALIGVSFIPITVITAKLVVSKSQVMFNNVQNSLTHLNRVTQEKFTGVT